MTTVDYIYCASEHTYCLKTDLKDLSGEKTQLCILLIEDLEDIVDSGIALSTLSPPPVRDYEFGHRSAHEYMSLVL